MGALIGAGASLLGGILGGNSAEDAAQTSANAQLEAARIAADAQRFRPVGITSRFGSSNFQTDAQGNLTGAGYNVAPDIAALRDQFLAQASAGGAGLGAQGLQGAQSLFNLGQQYLGTSPEQTAADWMAKQQQLLQPSRDMAQSKITQNLFNTGRGGLSTAQGGNLGNANPEQQAYYNALMQQDLQLSADAMAQGRAQTQFGAGLFGLGSQAASSGYAPIQTQIGLASNLEQLGQGTLDTGAMLGGRAAQGGAAAGQSLLQGGTNAAKTMQAASGGSPFGAMLQGLGSNSQFTSGIANWMGGGAQAGFSQTGLGSSGFGSGLAYGNQDLGAYF
jgi:hypothetical protein